MSETQFPEALHSEILPNLWQGGTHDYDTIGQYFAGLGPTLENYDAVYTLYGSANPAGWGVKEIRFAFFDGNMDDFDPESDLALPVAEAHRDLKAGKRVLIRCQAGLNRSGLVMALVLIRDGYAPDEAIALIRQQRGPDALFNGRFVDWLCNGADLSYWRAKRLGQSPSEQPSTQAA